jgi:hypothetical protein
MHRKRIIYAIAAAVLMIASLAARADVKTFTWIAPTQYEDGSALAPQDILGYRLVCAPSGSDGAVPALPTSFAKDFPPGTYTCTLATRALNGQESVPSNAVVFTVPEPPPPPPPRPNPPVLSVD